MKLVSTLTLLLCVPIIAVADEYSNERLSINITQQLAHSQPKFPYNANLLGITAGNGGTENDLKCELRANSAGRLQCLVNLTICDDTQPFPTDYQLTFSDLHDFYKIPGRITVSLKNCDWFTPANHQASLQYVYFNHVVIESKIATIDKFLANNALNFSPGEPLPESKDVAPNISVQDTNYQDFVNASLELSALYQGMINAIPESTDSDTRKNLQSQSSQLSAYATRYANRSLSSIAAHTVSQNSQQLVVTGQVADYKKNVALLRTMLSDSQISPDTSMTIENKSAIAKRLDFLQSNQLLGRSSFAQLREINETISN